MSAIDTVYIACYSGDLHMVRSCAASVRYWHPSVDICLIRDLGKGDFSTDEIEKTIGARVLQLDRKVFGWGYSKLEPLFLPQRSKFLVLDADTVLLGPVLDRLEEIDADFIVDDGKPSPELVKQLYFDVDKLKKLDPSFTPCGYNFNSGQWVGTSGLVDRSDFELVLDWSEPPRQTHPEAFMGGEQGILNYVIENCANQKKLSLARIDLMLWLAEDLAKIDLALIANKQGHNKILHWAGFKYGDANFARRDIHAYFEREYYKDVPLGPLKNRWRFFRLSLNLQRKRLRQKLTAALKSLR